MIMKTLNYKAILCHIKKHHIIIKIKPQINLYKLIVILHKRAPHKNLLSMVAEITDQKRLPVVVVNVIYFEEGQKKIGEYILIYIGYFLTVYI